MILPKNYTAVALACIASCFAGEATAATSSGTTQVSATVLTNCTIVASPLAFGSAITNVGGANIDSTSTITLSCTPNAIYNVALDNGLYALSGARRLRGTVSGEYLPYEIYTSNTHSARWGQTISTDTVGGTATTGVATLTAYGRIPQSASPVSADTYGDTVTATVNF